MVEHITITVRVNGRERVFATPPGRRLLDLLRTDAGLTGTKEGCGAGECGACTVLLDGRPVPSCLVLAAAVDGREVTTIEGLAKNNELHPIQQAMVDSGGVQCGFCTPGLIMTATAMLDHGISEKEEQRRRLAGNLCRCTGYTKVFEAVEKAEGKEPEDG